GVALITDSFSNIQPVFRMGSESTIHLRIFFRHNKDELKGPFTERQVQEWYRKKLFENSFSFCFMESDNSPDDSTPSY
ncbi:hypothetical protein PMAYCL1PPCAC_00531, partial [Pristionchus mayeri]